MTLPAVYTTDHVPGSAAEMTAGWIVWGYANDLAKAMAMMQNIAARDQADGIVGARITTSAATGVTSFGISRSATTYDCYGIAFRWAR
ncbi:hypothetical protein [Nocardia crassostreae]|uniref:hypothetical protein n=1 Tax=Nocardia crassostreae TaxID=53428 RepID=UPI00082FA303|nr:hypothetical protein [Nocardia crassostreae]